MEKSNDITELAKALAQFQAQIGAVKFNAVNPFLKNRYADLGAVIETAKPIMAANGLSVSQLVGGSGDSICVTTVLMHASGQYISDTAALLVGDEKGKSRAQVAGSIVTYLRRYALAAVLGLYADEDTDGNGGDKPGEAKSKPQPVVHETTATAATTGEGDRVIDAVKDKDLLARWSALVAKAKAAGVEVGLVVKPGETLVSAVNKAGKEIKAKIEAKAN